MKNTKQSNDTFQANASFLFILEYLPVDEYKNEHPHDAIRTWFAAQFVHCFICPVDGPRYQEDFVDGICERHDEAIDSEYFKHPDRDLAKKTEIMFTALAKYPLKCADNSIPGMVPTFAEKDYNEYLKVLKEMQKKVLASLKKELAEWNASKRAESNS